MILKFQQFNENINSTVIDENEFSNILNILSDRGFGVEVSVFGGFDINFPYMRSSGFNYVLNIDVQDHEKDIENRDRTIGEVVDRLNQLYDWDKHNVFIWDKHATINPYDSVRITYVIKPSTIKVKIKEGFAESEILKKVIDGSQGILSDIKFHDNIIELSPDTYLKLSVVGVSGSTMGDINITYDNNSIQSIYDYGRGDVGICWAWFVYDMDCDIIVPDFLNNLSDN